VGGGNMSADEIAHALGGRKMGGRWMARCPAHDDRTPSLSIREAADGKVLVRCHAGCEQEHVIEALRSRGLWTDIRRRLLGHRAAAPKVERQPDQDGARPGRGPSPSGGPRCWRAEQRLKLISDRADYVSRNRRQCCASMAG
jgi:hypothetical protein